MAVLLPLLLVAAAVWFALSLRAHTSSRTRRDTIGEHDRALRALDPSQHVERAVARRRAPSRTRPPVRRQTARRSRPSAPRLRTHR